MAITHARTQANIINMMSMSRIQQVKTEKKKLQRGLLFMSVWERQRKMMGSVQRVGDNLEIGLLVEEPISGSFSP